MSFTLPPLGNDQPPAFTDAASCRVWLEKSSQTNAVQMQALLLRQINLLNRFQLPASERLAILELLRPAAHAAQEELAKRFSGRPLPLAPPEQAAFDSCRTLWNALGGGYMRCLESSLNKDSISRERAVISSQRALATLAALQLDLYCAGRQVEREHWRLLHEIFALAEEFGIAGMPVEDPVRHGKHPTSALAAWSEALLLQMSSPHEFNHRQLIWISRWARRWGGKTKLFRAPPVLDGRSFPLCVDLLSDQPAAYLPRSGEGARWLDVADLRHSIKKRLAMLEQGAKPAELQLGDDCTQPACGDLLKQLYMRWCKGGIARRHERRPVSNGCQFIGGLEAIHYYLSGRKRFEQPGMPDMDRLRREREQMATFGHNGAPSEEVAQSMEFGYMKEQWEVVENWRMLDESASGMRITRALSRSGVRVGGGQLVAVQPDDAREPLLGMVRWVMLEGSDALSAGVNVFAGKPEPVALRTSGLELGNDRWHQGFLLPEVAVINQAPSMITPPGWYRRDRIVEVYAEDKPLRLRVTGLIERGLDFERVSWQLMT